ncbi:MAG TPA: zinc-binding dehydrogenase [Acidimicrobiales bacterium]|nr:zinc-binding dehydrogenase [Acidimicrobiales bacterium]
MTAASVPCRSGAEQLCEGRPGWSRAARLGATVVTPDQLTVPGKPTDLVEAPFDAAIECSGRAEAMTGALAQLGTHGTLVVSGTGLVQPRLDAMRIIVNELHVTGTMEYGRSDFGDALGMLATGRLPTADLIEPEDVALSGIQAAMERLAAGELVSKVMVVPRA